MKNIKIRFGRYKGKNIKELPINYLKWCIKENILKGQALLYAKIKTNYPKDKWKVTVEDAVCGNGEYVVLAYDFIHSIKETNRINNIQISQSYRGTTFSAEKI